MRTISLLEVLDLVAGDVADSESRIQQVFEWRFDRDMSIARWALGVAASLTIAVLVAFFRGGTGDAVVTTRELIIALCCSLASGVYGLYALVRLRRINKEFIAALKLYSQFRSVRAFVRLYRGM